MMHSTVETSRWSYDQVRKIEEMNSCRGWGVLFSLLLSFFIILMKATLITCQWLLLMNHRLMYNFSCLTSTCHYYEDPYPHSMLKRIRVWTLTLKVGQASVQTHTVYKSNNVMKVAIHLIFICMVCGNCCYPNGGINGSAGP